MIDVGPSSSAVAGAVLLAVFVIGVAAGRTKKRLTALLFGLALVVGASVAVSALTRPAGLDRTAQFTALYTMGVPLAAAFLAGWLCARGSWVKRLVVVAVAVALVLLVPYAELGRATAALVPV
jgi:hypothetical protein